MISNTYSQLRLLKEGVRKTSMVINSFHMRSICKNNDNLILYTRNEVKNTSNFIHPSHKFHTSFLKFNEDGGTVDKQEDAARDPEKDRTKVISVETSQRYLESEAYRTTYGGEPIWLLYRRNFKGQFAPKKTRLSCIVDGEIKSGNPCPLCRDEYLVVDYQNVKLLKQFVSPYTDEILPTSKTHVCQVKQTEVEVAIDKSRMHGLLPFHIPFREYDYEEYMPQKDK